MPDMWEQALYEAQIKDKPLIRLSDMLHCGMVVRLVNGTRNHQVIEILVAPDGFSGMGIVRTMADNGYDETWLFEYHGKNDEQKWILLQDASEE